ncbi:hypothetical protein QJS10_CPB19g00176 [Acorus calamus]|uniref:Reverse transcriptase zinc-binding domain-containing protein n=1 Tax=Acorus calamus TaxID=4465 RepID=A0AAV9CGR9_ACOCL|nr:hypothetical protein QJS10_CPB19g00176 [Acorus calamus]
MRVFSAWINDEELMDMELQNQHFTWRSMREEPSLARLDRVLIDLEWDKLFSNVRYAPFHASCRTTHHCFSTPTAKPPLHKFKFKFEIWWTEVDGFENLAGKAGQVYSIRLGYAWGNQGAVAADNTLISRTACIWKAKIPIKPSAHVGGQPSESVVCSLCEAGDENIEHLFCSCTVARRLWDQLSVVMGKLLCFRSMEDLWEAARRMRKRNDRTRVGQIWLSIIPARTWALWRVRNEVIFKRSSCYFENMWGTTIGCIKD